MRRKKIVYFFLIGLLTLIVYSCDKDPKQLSQSNIPIELPDHFDGINYPSNNEYSPERWALGKRLFYDNILSSNQTLNCGSCHKPQFAFGDDRATSPGVKNRAGTRNVPSLANVAFHPHLLREGSNSSLEQQVFVPIQEHNEFDFNILQIAERMNADPSYVQQSMDAYDRIPDAFVITHSIANFERTLISAGSKYDLVQEGTHRYDAQETRGLQLFNEKNCSSCHSGFNFTNYAFENNGLYEQYADNGRERFTNLLSDRATFKVPSLRNVELTAPYMHDGSINSLEEVIEHYNKGGMNHINKSDKIVPLFLSEQDKRDLLVFLHSLTDSKFANDKTFQVE